MVVELLSLGSDISAFSADGNNCLHYAAINDRKGIVEILLRSGADPSIPNSSGTLPVELSKTHAVKELFLRDRSAIFSPIVQTRMLLTDYIEQMNLQSTTPSATAASPAVNIAASESNSMVFNMQNALGAARDENRPPSPVQTDTGNLPGTAARPVQLIRDISSLDRYVLVCIDGHDL